MTTPDDRAQRGMPDREERASGALTHARLVERAARWLANTQRCVLVLTEQARLGENPDAIGWDAGGRSILVECKASRSDFYADRAKPWRRVPEIAAGCSRYYMTPPALVTPEQVPEGWGLLECGPRIVRVVVRAAPQRAEIGLHQEISMLVNAVRRCHGDPRIANHLAPLRHIEPLEESDAA